MLWAAAFASGFLSTLLLTRIPAADQS
jgi:hypothetical protein